LFTASAANAVLHDLASANASVAVVPLSQVSPPKFSTHGADSVLGQADLRVGSSGQKAFGAGMRSSALTPFFNTAAESMTLKIEPAG
jgi:hypothetical protein